MRAAWMLVPLDCRGAAPIRDSVVYADSRIVKAEDGAALIIVDPKKGTIHGYLTR